jgi:hypothetical protein
MQRSIDRHKILFYYYYSSIKLFKTKDQYMIFLAFFLLPMILSHHFHFFFLKKILSMLNELNRSCPVGSTQPIILTSYVSHVG